jgi:hypothetical protein
LPFWESTTTAKNTSLPVLQRATQKLPFCLGLFSVVIMIVTHETSESPSSIERCSDSGHIRITDLDFRVVAAVTCLAANKVSWWHNGKRAVPKRYMFFLICR